MIRLVWSEVLNLLFEVFWKLYVKPYYRRAIGINSPLILDPQIPCPRKRWLRLILSGIVLLIWAPWGHIVTIVMATTKRAKWHCHWRYCDLLSGFIQGGILRRYLASIHLYYLSTKGEISKRNQISNKIRLREDFLQTWFISIYICNFNLSMIYDAFNNKCTHMWWIVNINLHNKVL